MNNPRDFAEKYLHDGKVVQIASTSGDTPWICSVYYVVDKDLNVYWLSYPTRRHSGELDHNPKAALALVAKADIPVAGIQAEGKVTVVKNVVTVTKVMTTYIKKYGSGEAFLRNFKLKKNKHVMYCFSPTKIALFDEQNFGADYAEEFTV